MYIGLISLSSQSSLPFHPNETPDGLEGLKYSSRGAVQRNKFYNKKTTV